MAKGNRGSSRGGSAPSRTPARSPRRWSWWPRPSSSGRRTAWWRPGRTRRRSGRSLPTSSPPSWRSAFRSSGARAPAKGGPTRAAVILLTSNRGLAGGFNANLIKEGAPAHRGPRSRGYTVELHGIGKKGIGFFRFLGRKLARERQDIGDRPTADHAAEIVQPLIAAFVAGELASVDLVQAQFISALQTPPATVRILPVEPPRRGEAPARLHPGAERRGDPGGAAPALRAECALSRAGRDGGCRARRAAHGHEERHGQRAGDPRAVEADVQSPAAGADHAGDRGNRRRRRGAAR